MPVSSSWLSVLSTMFVVACTILVGSLLNKAHFLPGGMCSSKADEGRFSGLLFQPYYWLPEGFAGPKSSSPLIKQALDLFKFCLFNFLESLGLIQSPQKGFFFPFVPGIQFRGNSYSPLLPREPKTPTERMEPRLSLINLP